MNFLKESVTSAIKVIIGIIIILFTIGVINGLYQALGGKPVIGKYTEGYLKSGSRWEDEKGVIYVSIGREKIEIWDREITTSKGERLRQIYLLSGNNAGKWGYTEIENISY